MRFPRRLPASLFGRLLAIAALATLAALTFAGVAIGGVLERFVMRGLDERLDAQVLVLARAVRADGTLDPSRAVSLPRFDEAGSGWQWWVVGRGGRVWQGSPDPLPSVDPRHPAPLPPAPDRARLAPFPPEGPAPAEGRGPGGAPAHLRRLLVPTPAGPVLVAAAAPRRIFAAPLRAAMAPLLATLACLGIGLGLATLVQLRLGLRPLRAIGAELAEVRAGRRRHIAAGQPSELRPLVAELNALIDQNEAGLAHARGHVANLAHGLKTPLAALGLALAERGRDPDGSLAAAVARIDRQIRHHLGRARAAAPGGGGRARAGVAATVADLVAVLERVHAGRGVAPRVAVADGLTVAVDPQDLAEMLGNLLDNAWRHAAATVAIAAAREGAAILVTIDDDGPGLIGAALADALVPGRRLDERGDGHGFGLPIAHELAELSGGALALAPSPILPGLRAALRLPAAASG